VFWCFPVDLFQSTQRSLLLLRHLSPHQHAVAWYTHHHAPQLPSYHRLRLSLNRVNMWNNGIFTNVVHHIPLHLRLAKIKHSNTKHAQRETYESITCCF
jgi:hypothetical protein